MKLVEEFKKYNPLELISLISSLFLDKRNLSAHIAIEQGVYIASAVARGNLSPKPNVIINFLNNSDETDNIRSQQDPPEELFTERVVFHGGNFTVFPGITTSGVYINELLSKALLTNQPDNFLEDDQKNKLVEEVSALLKLSTKVAERAGIEPNEIYHDEQSKLRFVHPAVNFLKLRDSIVFTTIELQTFLTDGELEFIEEFSLNVETIQLKSFDPNNCLLSLKPLIKHSGKIILANPSGIISSIRQIILKGALSKDKPAQLAKLIVETEATNVTRNLSFLSMQIFPNILPKKSFPAFFEENLYRIDDKKLCYVQIVGDDFENFDLDYAFPHIDASTWAKYAENRTKEVFEDFLLKTFNDYEFLHLMVLVPSGRTAVSGFNYRPQNCHTMVITSSDLETVARLRDVDKWVLWNFSEAVEALHDKGVKYLNFSTLDMLAPFLRYHSSFYIGDDFRPTYIQFANDYGRELREKRVLLEDRHNQYHYNDHLEPVIKRYTDSEIPIYVPENFALNYELVVECNSGIIWCDAEISEKQLRMDFVEMIAYWVWQISTHYPNLLKSSRIYLRFDAKLKAFLKEPSASEMVWTGRDQILTLESIKDILSVESTVYGFNLTLRDTALPFMLEDNNSFERLIVKTLFSIYSKNSSEDEFNSNVDKIAPYGKKKKINFHAFEYLPSKRRAIEVSEYFENKHLDSLGDYIRSKFIDNKIFDYGVIGSQFKADVYSAIKEFYIQKLIEKVSVFQKDALLIALLEVYETHLFENIFENSTFISSIECYKGLNKKIETTINSRKEKDTSALSTRFLIEFAYNTSFDGEKTVILNRDLEELISIGSQYVSWGMRVEEVRCRIGEYELSFLKSDRIGVRGTSGQMETFFWEKNKESLLDRYNSFHDMKEKQEENKTLFNSLVSSFTKEYGFGFELLFHFADKVGELVSREEEYIYSDTELSIEFKELKPAELEALLKYLTFIPREEWTKVPEGFEPHEIYPWRFKRRLSLLRTPLLKLQTKEYFLGPNMIRQAISYQVNQFLNAGYPANHFSTTELRSFVGKVAEKIGSDFQNEVETWLRTLSLDFRIEPNIEIGPNHRLYSEKNIGDIDILIIDTKKQELIVIELKAISGSKTAVEISSEINKHFLDSAEGKPSSMQKHLARVRWVKDNIALVVEEFRLPKVKYKVHHVFLTDELIPAVFMKKLPKHIGSFETLKWQKLKDFRRLL